MSTFPLELQLWLSPTFPVGSFAYSHGLEWAAGSGRVKDRGTAQAWLADLLQYGAPRNDAILLADAWRAARATDHGRLAATNELALALAGSRERYLETSAQGNAFVATVLAAWDNTMLRELFASIEGDVAYPIAVGTAAGAGGLTLDATLQAYLASVVSNLVSALVRLSVVGQTDGQRVLAALAPAISACAIKAEAATVEDLGNAAFVSDIAALAHEIQETRMFRT